jgi:hypothetical protein
MITRREAVRLLGSAGARFAAAFGGIGARRFRLVRLKRWLSCSAVTVLVASCLFAETPPRVQTFPVRDTTGLIAPKVKAEAVNYLARKSVRITMEGEDHEGLALLEGTDFQDGVIEADIALKITTPPGVSIQALSGLPSA